MSAHFKPLLMTPLLTFILANACHMTRSREGILCPLSYPERALQNYMAKDVNIWNGQEFGPILKTTLGPFNQ